MIWFEKSDLLQVFYFFSSCKLPGKKEKQTEKTLKGLCICLIHLEFYFLIT